MSRSTTKSKSSKTSTARSNKRPTTTSPKTPQKTSSSRRRTRKHIPTEDLEGESRFEQVQDLNRDGRLHELFTSIPDARFQENLSYYLPQLPTSLSTIDDFRKWWWVTKQATTHDWFEKREHEKGVRDTSKHPIDLLEEKLGLLEDLAQEHPTMFDNSGYTQDTPLREQTTPLEVFASGTPNTPGTGLGVQMDPNAIYAKANEDEAEAKAFGPGEGDPRPDAIKTNPFMGNINDMVNSIPPEKRDEYKQEALKESDQRQLLMLLVGNMEAEMFFEPATGQMRTPRQIITFIMELLKPYRMGNSTIGILFSHINYAINYVTKFGFQVVMVCAVVILLTMVLYVLCQVLYLMWTSQVVNSATFSFLYPIGSAVGKTFVWLASKGMTLLGNAKGANAIRTIGYNSVEAFLTSPVLQPFVKIGLTGGGALAVFRLLSKRQQYDDTKSLKPHEYALQLVQDRFTQMNMMGLLAQLTPDVMGLRSTREVGSGITVAQYEMMHNIQTRLLDLDKRVNELSHQALADLVVQYNRSHKAFDNYGGENRVSDRHLYLGMIMKATMEKSLELIDHQPEEFRKTLLNDFPEEMRMFHFLEANGHQRNVTDICKAYFLYWDDIANAGKGHIPITPYQDFGLGDYLKSTPVSVLRRIRKRFDTDDPAASQANQKWWRVHANLFKDKTVIDLESTFRPSGNTAAALLNSAGVPEVGKAILAKHPGWMHRDSASARKLLINRFMLHLDDLDRGYDLNVRHKTEEELRLLRMGKGKDGGFDEGEYEGVDGVEELGELGNAKEKVGYAVLALTEGMYEL